MKKFIYILPALILILMSCSTDLKSDEASTNITGTWDATAFQIDDQSATEDEKNARDILNFLTARDCYILTLTFNADLSLLTENSVNYLEINVNQQGTGLDIPCPTQSDNEVATYTFDGEVLVVTDSTGATVTLNAEVTGDMLKIDAADLDIPNLNGNGQLVFMRR